jgi:hypothetical protein
VLVDTEPAHFDRVHGVGVAYESGLVRPRE